MSLLPRQAGSSPVAATGPCAREQALHTALQQQIISKEEHDRQLRVLRDGGGGDDGRVLEAPTRQYGDRRVALHKGLWKAVAGPFTSQKEAETARTQVSHGRWKWNTDGDKKVFRCAAHVDCQVLMRVTNPLKEVGGGFYLEELDLAHSLEDNLYGHKRARLTVAQKAAVAERVEHGKKPRQMYAQDVLAAIAADPTSKLPGGGAVGMPLPCAAHP